MDIQEAREAFERRRANALNVSYEGLKANFDENSRLFGTRYNAGSINEKEWNLWLEAWQAKAQAVPDTYTPIVLALEDVQSKIAKTSFLTMDEENENEVMAVDANELAAYIDELIDEVSK
ncbi:hypothetical protein Q8H44_03965 [Acinetobacter lwoffii]|uniref:hypothetical protein n=1 Tax=Acinetobacter lwoffii TaxID=28090 RepID=UPI0027317DBA|nr:hypothetical protein [Acinetobacter lwoffii]MDP1316058.1 hypothetical protein [Acinetobacter lwoffii]